MAKAEPRDDFPLGYLAIGSKNNPMKRTLSPIAVSFFGLLFVLIAANLQGQTLVNYPLTQNLNPNSGPAPGLNPTLQYFDPPVQVNPSDYSGGYLNFMNNGDEVQFSFDATNYSNLTVGFKGALGVVFAMASADIKVYLKIGNGTETQIASRSFSAIFLGGDSHQFSLPIPSADHQPHVRIRITGTSSSFGIFSYFGINNLSLTSNSPSLQPYGYDTTHSLTQIPHEANASVVYGTDFGKVVTSSVTPSGYTDRVFQIRNEGTGSLNLSSVYFEGEHPSDFSVISSIPNSISAGGAANVTIRFNAIDNGKRTAVLNLVSNDEPSPYQFHVVGYGVSCNTFDEALQSISMETGQTNQLPASPEGSSSFNFISGRSAANDHSPLDGSRFYAHDNNGFDLYTSSNRSWYIRNETSTVNFGPVDVSNERGVYVAFNIAAVATSTIYTSDKFRSADYVELQVLKPGTTHEWSREIRLTGPNSESGRYSFTSGASLSRSYAGTGHSAPVETIANGNQASSRYNSIVLRLPETANFENLIFRIVVHSSSSRKIWLIDDVRVMSENSIYKTFTENGWKDLNGNATSAPGNHEKAVIAGSYDSSIHGNLSVCECEINPGASVRIASDTHIEVFGDIMNQGSLVVENNGNLIQKSNNAVNTGDIRVEKLFTFTDTGNPAHDRKQYNFVISPTVGQNLKNIYPPANPTVIKYNESTNFFVNHNGSYIPGKGFAIKEPGKATIPGNTVTAKFEGVPFNGVLAYPLSYTTPDPEGSFGYNLVGNPYPSSMDLQAFYDANAAVIGPTFYFWDNRGNTQYTQQGSSYNGDNYAKYNAYSGTGTGSGKSQSNGDIPSRIPNRYANVGTAFMVRALPTANGKELLFKNEFRAGTVGQSYFGKNDTHNPNDTAEPYAAKDRYWLGLRTPSGMEFMNAVVYFDRGMEAFGIDDTETFGSSDEIFTVIEDKRLAIQGRPGFHPEDAVSLGVSMFHAGVHTIEVLQKEGVFMRGQKIYLKDKYLNIVHELTESPYEFDTKDGVFTDRFEILYKNGEISDEPVLTTATQVKIQKINKEIVISSEKDKIVNVEIFNFGGWPLYKNASVNALEWKIPAQQFGKQIIVIKVETESGEVISRKMVNK